MVYKPSPREAALILLQALDERGQRRHRPMSRARLSRLTLSDLWYREQLTETWIRDVNEWLLSAGWIVFEAGATFGVVKTDIVANWPRVASKHTKDFFREVPSGSFDFSRLEHLLDSKQSGNTKSIDGGLKKSPVPAKASRRRT